MYADPIALEQACDTLRLLPPLVPSDQIERARIELADVARGKAFILQGGDCAESFDDVRFEIIRCKVALLSEQAKVLWSGLGLPIMQIGRIADQYAKPRSSPFETLPNGEIIHAFRGHTVNSSSLDDRVPNPQRLLLGYFHSAVTLNTLNHLEQEAKALGSSQSENQYTSHEALHLPYESAMTKGEYNTSATFLWLGETYTSAERRSRRVSPWTPEPLRRQSRTNSGALRRRCLVGYDLS